MIDETGVCFVSIDDIFSETVTASIEYAVFLQKEGSGDCWVSEKDESYFVVSGTPGLHFSWELKAVQKGYEKRYLDDNTLIRDDVVPLEIDLDVDFDSMLKEYDRELEVMFNDEESFESISGN